VEGLALSLAQGEHVGALEAGELAKGGLQAVVVESEG
jgi:hypothetical protein